MRKLCWCATLALVALIVGCGKSGTDAQSSASSSGGSGASKSELGAPVEIVTASGVEMISLPGGEFLMGSAKGNADEAPPHKVTISAFLIDKFEVTHEMFAK